ncbi:MAG: gamma-glutamyl-gamma-aminobutyrate hydrolase family protein [Armatimonadetes bacterium]|nr:gamma-glutamyl-gamma-aminobutyrate hydrolase family protein [Armatimonadota bacterium]MDE2205333.1 gamma-glutamyl-gamma-aminobutyrate hydrolase family protein [Armatimonadota bacterium]
MPRKVIGITCATEQAANGGSALFRLNAAYVQAVQNAGGAPVILPSCSSPEIIERYLGLIDGLLLSGGADIAPGLYGQEQMPCCGGIDPARDAFELPLVRRAIEQDMPVMGICRGIQVLNVALGGTLIQDLPEQQPSEIRHQQTDFGHVRSDATHTIQVRPGSLLHDLTQSVQIETNSMHHQALADLAPGLVVTARTSDSVIEAVEMPSRRMVLALQCHPEETASRDPISRRLFEGFISAV